VGGVDSHLHLDFFEPHEVAKALTRARAAGVDATITVGMDLPRSARGIELADAHDGVFAAVGIHPWCADAYADAVPLDELAALARHPRVVAIGEVGLDFVDNLATGASYAGREARAVQEACLRAQIGLAAELDLPLIVHSRGAHDAVLRLLDEVPCRAAIQFFEGDAAVVRRYVERVVMRVIATGGVVGIAVVLGAILVAQDVQGWIVGLAVGLTSVILAALLWSSRQL
jgi:TatD DNase family protein